MHSRSPHDRIFRLNRSPSFSMVTFRSISPSRTALRLRNSIGSKSSRARDVPCATRPRNGPAGAVSAHRRTHHRQVRVDDVALEPDVRNARIQWERFRSDVVRDGHPVGAVRPRVRQRIQLHRLKRFHPVHRRPHAHLHRVAKPERVELLAAGHLQFDRLVGRQMECERDRFDRHLLFRAPNPAPMRGFVTRTSRMGTSNRCAICRRCGTEPASQ